MLSSGAVVDTLGILICSDSNDQSSPDVSFGLGVYLVAWADGRGGVCGMRVNTSGLVLDPNGFSIGGTSSGYPSVAFDGACFLVVWEEAVPDTSPAGTTTYGQLASLPRGRFWTQLRFKSALQFGFRNTRDWRLAQAPISWFGAITASMENTLSMAVVCYPMGRCWIQRVS